MSKIADSGIDEQQRQAGTWPPGMSGYCKLLTERGVQYLCMPNCTKIPLQVDCVATNDIASKASLLTNVTVQCNAAVNGITYEQGEAMYRGEPIPHSFNASSWVSDQVVVVMFSTWAVMGDTIEQPLQYSEDVATIIQRDGKGVR